MYMCKVFFAINRHQIIGLGDLKDILRRIEC